MSTTTPDSPRSSSRAIALLTAGLGAAVIVGTVWGSAAPTVAAAAARDESNTADVAGVDSLEIDAAATSFTIRFDDVDEATLEVRDTSGEWTLERDEDTLVVKAPDRSFFSWFGSRNGRATLTLPADLVLAETEIDFGAGSLVADGDFGDLDVDLGAGDATLTGSARELSVQVGAGRADLDLDGVRTADLEISAGDMIVALTGDAPSEVDLAVSAGSLELTLPDDEYDVTSDVSAGDFTNDLRTAAGAPHRLHAEVSAGDATVTPGD